MLSKQVIKLSSGHQQSLEGEYQIFSWFKHPLPQPCDFIPVRSAGWAPAPTAALGNVSSPQLCFSYESATNVQWCGETRKWHCLKATIKDWCAASAKASSQTDGQSGGTAGWSTCPNCQGCQVPVYLTR